MSILGILVALVILCLVYWAATKLMDAFGIGDPIRTVVIVALVILGILWLVSQIAPGVLRL